MDTTNLVNGAREWYSASLGNRITAIAVLLSAMTFMVMASLGLVYVNATLHREAENALLAELKLNKEIVQHTARAFLADLEALAHNTLLSNSLVDTAGREIYIRPALEDSRLSTEFGACLSLYDHRGELVLLGSSDRCVNVEASSALSATVATEEPHWVLSEDGTEVAIVFPILFPTTKTAEGFLQAIVPLSRLIEWETVVRKTPRYAWDISLPGGQSVLSYGTLAPGGHSSTISLEMQIAGRDPLTLTLRGGRSDTFQGASFTSLGAMYVVLSLCALGIVAWLARRAGEALAEPIVTLRNIARAIEAGVSTHAGPAADGHDEIAELSIAFGGMLFKLKQYQRNLEQTVETRTRELLDATRHLAEAMASAQLVVWSADLGPLNLRYLSPNADQLLQLNLNGKHASAQVYERLTRRSKRDWLRAIKAVRTGETNEVTVELELNSPADSTSQWLRCRMVNAGQSVGEKRIDGFMIDITTEVASVYRAHLLSDAIQEAQNGIVIAEITGGKERNVFVNQAFARITGYSQEEILGRSSKMLQGISTSATEVERIRQALMRGESCESLLLNYKKDGTPFWNELRLSPRPSPCSKPSNVSPNYLNWLRPGIWHQYPS